MTNVPPTTLFALAAALRSGTVALPDYLDQLQAHFETREPQVEAFLPEPGRFERVRREAADLLARYPEPEKRPLLFGIPLGVKDIFHAQGFVTRAGSPLPSELLQGETAVSVSALRRAGALILGKTVTTEFAYFAPGPTRNPHNPDHTPGGSSSGSAAAVGAGLCPLALGTQTIGSISRPAAFCGVVGYKPSYDRISRRGVIPLSAHADHIGFFAPDVSGAELAASVLCTHWQMVSDGLPVLGIPAGPYLNRASAEGLDHFQGTVEHLRRTGIRVEAVPAMPDFDAIYARHNALVAAEAARVHADWYANYGDRYHPKTAELIERGRRVSQAELEAALQGQYQLRRELTRLMDDYALDAWISPPAVGPAPAGLDSTGDPVMNLPWTHAGLPTITLPTGRSAAGLPMGLQLAARWYADELLFSWAADLEQALAAANAT